MQEHPFTASAMRRGAAIMLAAIPELLATPPETASHALGEWLQQFGLQVFACMSAVSQVEEEQVLGQSFTRRNSMNDNITERRGGLEKATSGPNKTALESLRKWQASPQYRTALEAELRSLRTKAHAARGDDRLQLQQKVFELELRQSRVQSGVCVDCGQAHVRGFDHC